PHLMNVLEHLTAALEIEPAAVGLVIVRELQRAIDPHMPGGYRRRTEVVLRTQQILPKRFHVVLENLDLAVGASAVAEHSKLVRELASEIVAQEPEVVVLFHDAAGFLEPPL